jgi:hypothetical protein
MKLPVSSSILKSKTFWTGLVTVAFGVAQIVNGNTSSGIQTVLIGVALVTGRDAIQKVIEK